MEAPEGGLAGVGAGLLFPLLLLTPLLLLLLLVSPLSPLLPTVPKGLPPPSTPLLLLLLLPLLVLLLPTVPKGLPPPPPPTTTAAAVTTAASIQSIVAAHSRLARRSIHRIALRRAPRLARGPFGRRRRRFWRRRRRRVIVIVIGRRLRLIRAGIGSDAVSRAFGQRSGAYSETRVVQ